MLAFLFNVLTNSLQIEDNLQSMITYNEAGDWVNYYRALGTIVNYTVFFDPKDYMYLFHTWATPVT